MRSRLTWLVLAGFVIAFAPGCGGSGSDNPPKAETTAGTKKLELKTPGGAGPGAGAPAPKPE